MGENWRWIKGFEGDYKISDRGRVKSYKCKKDGYILSESNTTKGYLKVRLYKDTKSFNKEIHRLVGKHFIPNPKNKLQINHKDMNKHNNCVDNLEWVTAKENKKHFIKNNPKIFKQNNKKQGKVVLQIDPRNNKVVNEFYSMREAERQTDIRWQNISKVANEKSNKGYKNKTAGGYNWKFKKGC